MSIDTIVEKWEQMRASSPPCVSGHGMYPVMHRSNVMKVTPNANKVPSNTKLAHNMTKLMPNASKVTPTATKATPNTSKATPNASKVSANTTKVSAIATKVSTNAIKMTSAAAVKKPTTNTNTMEITPKRAMTKPIPKVGTPSISTRAMVNTAIKSQLKNPRSGVSYVAIKKYIADNYQMAKVDTSGRLRLIKRYMRNALAKGYLVRSKPGKGLVGSFRFSLRKHKRPKQKANANGVVATKKNKAIKIARLRVKPMQRNGAQTKRVSKPKTMQQRKNQAHIAAKRYSNASRALIKIARK